MTLLKTSRLALSAMALSFLPLAAAEPLSLYENGQARLIIEIPPDLRARFAALPLDPIEDFARVFKEMTGAALSSTNGAGSVTLRVEFIPANSPGSPLASLPVGIRETASEIEVTGNAVIIRGETPAGISGGLYKLLENWGNRWILPGELGEIIPSKKSLSLPLGKELVAIGSDTGFGAYRKESLPWIQRNRLLQATWLPCFHYWLKGVEPKVYFESHPEYYALIDGVRTPTQPETTHPDVIRLKVEHAKAFFRNNPSARTYPMDPEDNTFFSESRESLALDGTRKGIDGLPAMSNRVVDFAAAVLKGFEKEFPDRTVGFYSYLRHGLPPDKARVDPRMVVGITRFGYCNLRMVPTENTPSPGQFEELVKDWAALTPNIYIYEYNPPSWAAQLPFPNYLTMGESMRRLHKLGAKGFYSDTIFNEHAPGVFLNSYLRRRMMVNPESDPAAILHEFTQLFYGPAGAKMEEYYHTMEQVVERYRDPARPSVGVSIYRYEELFPRDVVAKATEMLDAAQKIGGLTALTRQRLDYTRLGHDYLVNYLAAIDAAKTGNYEASKAAFQKTLRSIALQERASNSEMSDARGRIAASRATTLATYFPKEEGMSTDWKLLGPVPREALKESEVQAILSQDSPQPVTIGKTRWDWKDYRSPEGLLNFNRAFQRSGLENPLSMSFASTTAVAPEAMDAIAFVSSMFNPFTVYLNGKEIFHRDGYNFDAPDRNARPVRLRKGVNHFVFVCDERTPSTEANPQNDGFFWTVSLSLRGKDGAPLHLPAAQ